MQLYPMIISKFTGDVSKTTSKSTSKTNQIKVRGGHGGAYPLYAKPLPGLYSPPKEGCPVPETIG